MAATAKAMAHGALMGARGNSGVILSQLLRGLAEVLGAAETCTAADVQRALTRAAALCYAAVATPVEGTLLTVARESAEAAAALGAVDLGAVVAEARAAAVRSLARTPDLLPQLRAAGVVDAGGRGLCVLLEALERVVSEAGSESTPVAAQLLVPRDRSGLTAAREAGSEAYAYEVQFLLREAAAEAVDVLTAELGGLGDSLVVVGGDGLYNVHVHVNDVGAAIEAGVEAGRPFRITVTRFADQVAGERTTVLTQRTVDRSVVAVVPGSGLVELYEQAGASVVAGGPSANPSTAELLEAVRASAASEVVLLPNDANVLAVVPAAAAAARAEGFSVAVVPTRSPVQGLAALAVADATRPFADDVAAMAEAAGSTRWAEVTTAVRESATMAGICRPGDVLGLLEGDVVLIGADVEQVGRELLARLLTSGGDLVTVVTGADAPDGLADRLLAWLEQCYPAVEAMGYAGAQPHYPLLLGVE
ncbi:MAG: DAK2 domain-containing protein, partial [Frankiales bacterium]|nr:DAK2 domain-containing protein [Frankiales bacterium]